MGVVAPAMTTVPSVAAALVVRAARGSRAAMEGGRGRVRRGPGVNTLRHREDTRARIFSTKRARARARATSGGGVPRGTRRGFSAPAEPTRPTAEREALARADIFDACAARDRVRNGSVEIDLLASWRHVVLPRVGPIRRRVLIPGNCLIFGSGPRVASPDFSVAAAGLARSTRLPVHYAPSSSRSASSSFPSLALASTFPLASR